MWPFKLRIKQELISLNNEVDYQRWRAQKQSERIEELENKVALLEKYLKIKLVHPATKYIGKDTSC